MVLRSLTVKVSIDTLAQVYDPDNRINVISFLQLRIPVLEVNNQ